MSIVYTYLKLCTIVQCTSMILLKNSLEMGWLVYHVIIWLFLLLLLFKQHEHQKMAIIFCNESYNNYKALKR